MKPNNVLIRRAISLSDMDDRDAEQILKDQILPRSGDWVNMLTRLITILGVISLLSGIVFFFAYNWDVLEKVGKIGLVGLLLVICVFFALRYFDKNRLVLDLCMFGASLLVGVLLAIIDQQYHQNFFTVDNVLLWILLITPWTVVLNRPINSLLYVVVWVVFSFIYSSSHYDRGSLAVLWMPIMWLSILIIDKHYFQKLNFSRIGYTVLVYFFLGISSFYVTNGVRELKHDMGIWEIVVLIECVCMWILLFLEFRANRSLALFIGIYLCSVYLVGYYLTDLVPIFENSWIVGIYIIVALGFLISFILKIRNNDE